MPDPACFRLFVVSFDAHCSATLGLEGSVDKAIGRMKAEEKSELAAFFRAARTGASSDFDLVRIWGRGDPLHLFRRKSIGPFFDLVVRRLEASISSDKEKRRRFWAQEFGQDEAS